MTRKIPALLLLWFAMMGGFVPGATAQPPQAARAPSLYTRLGGYDALAAVTDDFITSSRHRFQHCRSFSPGSTTTRRSGCDSTSSCAIDELNRFKVPPAQQTAVMGAQSAR